MPPPPPRGGGGGGGKKKKRGLVSPLWSPAWSSLPLAPRSTDPGDLFSSFVLSFFFPSPPLSFCSKMAAAALRASTATIVTRRGAAVPALAAGARPAARFVFANLRREQWRLDLATMQRRSQRTSISPLVLAPSSSASLYSLQAIRASDGSLEHNRAQETHGRREVSARSHKKRNESSVVVLRALAKKNEGVRLSCEQLPHFGEPFRPPASPLSVPSGSHAALFKTEPRLEPTEGAKRERKHLEIED